jgi:hypothetical protein
MRRHVVEICLSLLLLSLLLAPIAAPKAHSYSTSENTPTSMHTAKPASTNVSWHDDCASTDGWIEQNASSGFDPKHEIFESGTLQTTSGYLTVTGIADPVTARKGPLFIKELNTPVPIDAIEMF